MSNNLELRKYHLISLIIALQDEDSLAALEAYLAQKDTLNTNDLLLTKLAKPMRKTISVEELVKEQDYKSPSFESVRKLAREIDIQEPIEDLLKMLTP
jgi:hypothetical protein